MSRNAFRNTNEDHRSLDLRELKRLGFLDGPGRRTLFWKRNGEVISSIGIETHFERLILRYTHEPHYGERQHKEYSVFLASTPCNYGGERRWFICPASGCSRRVLVLHSGSIFACRHCLDLSYESQREAPYARALRKAQKIHMKLGGTGCTGDDFPEKPKWMHLRTYSRLAQTYENAIGSSWPPFLLKSIALNG